MKAIAYAVILAASIPASVRASVSINVGLGDMYASTNTSTPFPTGGLLNILALDSGTWSSLDLTNVFSQLTNSFTPAGATLVAQLANDDVGGPGQTGGFFNFSYSGNFGVGDQLLLVAYPTLTLASLQPGLNTPGFFFRTDNIIDGSDIAWLAPADGGTYALGAYTLGTGFGSVPNGQFTSGVGSQAGSGAGVIGGGFTTASPPPPAPAPVINSPAWPVAVVGQTFSYQITASGQPTEYGAFNLPGGLTINTTNGLITGTPTQPGTFENVAISASNNSGATTNFVTFTITPNEWIWRAPTLQGNALLAAAMSTNASPTIVAVGEIGTILTKRGTNDWQRIRTEIASDIEDVIWAGTNFITGGLDASGTPLLLRSADGTNWTRTGFPAGLNPFDIGGTAAGGNRLATINSAGQQFFSTNGGVFWLGPANNLPLPNTNVEYGWAGYSALQANGRGLWVAGGSAGTLTTSTNNGTSWTKRTNSTADFSFIETDGRGFMAFGYNATGSVARRSTNGVNWTDAAVALGTNAFDLSGIFGVDGRFLATLYSQKLLISTNGGGNWTTNTSLSDAGFDLSLVQAAVSRANATGGRIHAFGNAGLVVSFGGTNPTVDLQSVPFTGGNPPTFFTAAGANGAFVAVDSESGRTIYSSNSLTFSVAPGEMTMPAAVASHDSGFVGARYDWGASGILVETSSDGASWEVDEAIEPLEITLPENSYPFVAGVAIDGNGRVMVLAAVSSYGEGATYDLQLHVFDGAAWQEATGIDLDFLGSGPWNSARPQVQWDGSQFLLLSPKGVLHVGRPDSLLEFTSIDTLNWQPFPDDLPALEADAENPNQETPQVVYSFASDGEGTIVARAGQLGEGGSYLSTGGPDTFYVLTPESSAWQPVEPPASPLDYYEGCNVVWTGSVFASANSAGILRTSEDGINWTRRALGADVKVLTWTGTQLVGLTEYSAVITHPLGLSEGAKIKQTISAFAPIGGKTFGTAPFVVDVPVATSGLPVALTVKSGPATIIDGNIVKIAGGGPVTLAANQAGDEYHEPAVEVTTSFNVAVSPTFSATPATLPAFSTRFNTPSAPQSFTVNGAGLVGAVSVLAPAGYQISSDAVTYGTSLTLQPSEDGGIEEAVSVRLAPAATAATRTGNVRVTTQGATPSVTLTRNVAVTGAVVAPSLTVSATSLAAFTTPLFTASAPRPFTVSGRGLPGTVTVTAPAGFEVSETGNVDDYADSLTLSPTDAGILPLATIRVRLAESELSGAPKGNVTVGTQGVSTRNVAVSGTVSGPAVTVSATTLTGFAANFGSASAVKTFTVSGSNLRGDLTLTAPEGYELARSGTTSYDTTLSLARGGNNAVATTTIAVRLAASATSGVRAGDLVVSTDNTTNRIVKLSGTVSPTLTATPATLPAFSTRFNTPSAAQSFTVNGAGLLNNVTLRAPAGFQIAAGSGEFTTNAISLAPQDGLVQEQVAVRLAPAATVATRTGNVSAATQGATVGTTITRNVAVTGAVVAPSLTVSATSLAAFTTPLFTASAPRPFTVSGRGLPGTVTVTAPAGFEVSETGNVDDYADSLTLSPTDAGILPLATIRVRLAESEFSGAPKGNVTVGTQGVSTRNVAVSGAVTGPVMTPSATAISGFAANFGSPSAVKTFTVTANNLLSDISLTCSEDFEISLDGREFQPSLEIDRTRTIYVRIAEFAQPGAAVGEITLETEYANSRTIRLSGSVAGPSLSVNRTALTGFSANYGAVSSAQAFTVIGSRLVGEITVSTGGEFELSANNRDFDSLLVLPATSGVTRTIYVRLSEFAGPGPVSDEITVESDYANPRSVTLTGNVRDPVPEDDWGW